MRSRKGTRLSSLPPIETKDRSSLDSCTRLRRDRPASVQAQECVSRRSRSRLTQRRVIADEALTSRASAVHSASSSRLLLQPAQLLRTRAHKATRYARSREPARLRHRCAKVAFSSQLGNSCREPDLDHALSLGTVRRLEGIVGGGLQLKPAIYGELMEPLVLALGPAFAAGVPCQRLLVIVDSVIVQ